MWSIIVINCEEQVKSNLKKYFLQLMTFNALSYLHDCTDERLET